MITRGHRAVGPGRRLRTAGAVAGALTLLAALIRVPTLAQQSFWLDEGYTVHLVGLSFGGMLDAIPRTESTPPLYYVLGWGWTRLFGASEFGLRSLSALAGILTIPVSCATARRLGGIRAAAGAGLLLSAAPLMVWYSQEARAYALAALLSAASLLGVVGWLTERRRGWLALWATAVAAGLATEYFVVFVFAGELAVLWWRGRRERLLVAATSLPLLVCAALVPLALAQRGTGHVDYIAQGSLATRLLQVPKQLIVGYASPGQLVTAAVAALLIAAGVLWPLARRAALRRRALPALVPGLTGVLLPIVAALLGADFLDTRNLLPAVPALAIGAGVALGAPDARRAAGWPALGLLATGLLVVVLVDANPVYQRDDWRGVADVLGPARVSRVIVATPGSGLVPLSAYLGGLRALTATGLVSELDVVAIPSQQLGSGLGEPPRPVAPLPVPAGLRMVADVQTRTFTVLRYRATRPIAVTAPSVAADHLGSAGPAVILQPAGGSGP